MISDFERYLKDFERRVDAGETVLTKFLDINEQQLAKSLQSRYEINFFGGTSYAERTRAIINGANPRISEYHIVAYQIIYPKTLNITHRNILGTLMSLGLKRNLFGDIIVSEEECYFLCCSDIAEYLEQEFTMINNQKIKLKKVSYQQLETNANTNKQTITVIVPSLRLDVVVANGFGISRNKIVESINAKEVFINNKIVTKPDYEVKLNEIISYRGHGRLKLIEIGKVTKKNRLVISLEVYK